MPTVSLAPVFNSTVQFTAGGAILSGGLLNTYLAGTTTPTLTYQDSGGTTPNTNPIQLGTDGRLPAEMWLVAGTSYKFTLTDSGGLNPYTFDNIIGIGVATSGSGAFTTLDVTGNTILGHLGSNTVSIGNGNALFDGSGNLGIGVTPSAGQGTIQLIGSALSGIKLGNVNNTNPTTLDIYNEVPSGTFVPILYVGGLASDSTYSSQVGSYTQIGNRVFGEILIQINVKGAATGALALGTLPVTPGSGVGYPCTFKGTGLNLVTPFSILAETINTGKISLFTASALGGVAAQDTILANSCSLEVSFSYHV